MRLEKLESRRLLAVTPAVDAVPERDTQSSDPSHLFAAGDTLYFSANDGVHGHELWTSDGTAAGTVMVKDLLPGTASSHPQSFALMDGTIYFIAESVDSRQLWKTDGTDGGTSFV